MFLVNRNILTLNGEDNLIHQQVFASNTEGTPVYNTFPTTNTGTSLGMYQHLGIDGQNNKKTDFLNMSAEHSGGYNFWTSNSTQAPQLLTSITETGIKIDKSIANFFSMGVAASASNYIILNINPTAPPTNWVLAQYNPNVYVVQLSQATATLQTGTNYYAKYTDTQLIQLISGASNTSPLLDMTGVTGNILYDLGGTTIESILSSTQLTLTNSTNTSTLTASDLTFNSVSIPSQIQALQIKQTNSVPQYISAVIYADGLPPIAPTTTIAQQFGYTPSWYFKNTTANTKINWYLPPDENMVVGDVLGMYINVLNVSTTSNDNTPFLIIYTKPQEGDSNFFHSKCVYIMNQTPLVNTRYCFFMNKSGTCPTPSHYASTLTLMDISPVLPNPEGPFAPSEEILAFYVGTNSASPQNSVDFCLKSFGVMTEKGTQEIQFFPV